MPLKVLPVKVESINDLIRLTANIRKDRSVLISYEFNDEYIVGFYLPPQVKNVHGVFVYSTVDDPPNVISYSPNDGGKEVSKYEYTGSPLYVNIFISRLNLPPHDFIDLKDVEIVVVDVNDLKSLLYLAYTTTFEHLLVPFTWYLVNDNVFMINVEVPSGDDEEYLLIFRYFDSDVPSDYPYLAYDPRTDDVSYAKVPKEMNVRYLLITRVKEFFKFRV